MLDKNELRREAKAWRDALPHELWRERSLAVEKRLGTLPEFQSAEVVCCYVSFGREVHTHALLAAMFGEKRVLVPRVLSGSVCDVVEISAWPELSAGPFGILAPPAEMPPAELAHASMIIVPGVAFDPCGQRIGFGAGYYDRLLESFAGFKLGLAFEGQLLPEIPAQPHDIAMDAVLTEERLIRSR